MAEFTELSLCFTPGQESPFLVNLLKSSTNPALSKIQLHTLSLFWGSYKQELVNMALHNKGVDVSQVGFPLTEDLIGMNALLPIAGHLIARIGGQSAFHPTAWRIANRHQEGQLWSMPWMMDPRAIFYWKDMLDQTGISPEKAFTSASAIETTFGQMQTKGIQSPWVLGMSDKFVLIHAISSWVWGKGGDFISPKGNRALFTQDEALDGIEAFFKLGKYMPAENASFSAAQSHAFFLERKAAVTIADYGSLEKFRATLSPELRGLLGVALPPGPPLLAGSDLVVWRHTRKDHDVAHLLSALFSTEIQIKYSQHVGHLPVTLDALENLGEEKDAEMDMFIETLNAGRLFATTKFGGMLELQLAGILTDLWASVAKTPVENIRETLQKSLQPLQRRFDMMNEQ